ncbi:MAG TPA: diacylglycerol kinase family protein, partial [Pseudomonadales bacterium]|nr:diacylglycerol kinase family protein [Pseudomonadales bacterium]
MTRALAVVNPAAGGGRTARLWPDLRDRLRHLGLPCDHVLTRAPGDGRVLAAAAVAAGAELIVAVGGDGTLNEVINGVTGEDGRPLAAVGALLTGRGRDAARTLGLPRDPGRAAERLVHGGETRRDLGLVRRDNSQRFFLTVAGAGFDAVVAARAASTPGRGSVPYLRAVAASLR